VLFSERALTNKGKSGKNNNNETKAPTERYTIFHALFEALREKDKKRKKK